MKTEEKKLNLLGLAQRAGFLITGDELVEKAMKKEQKLLVLCANDASPSTQNRYQKMSQQYGQILDQSFSSDQISHALGKKRSICAVTNQGMIKKYLSYEAYNG